MKILYLILLFHASLQLQCDRKQITAHIGGEFSLLCTYDANRFRFSKKYWCRGDSRHTCETLVDSDGKTNTHRFIIKDFIKYGLSVRVTNLQFADTGLYWVGIDKIYADIMTSVNVVITEVPVSKPTLRLLSSAVDRPTCWGLPVTARCGCTKGTAVQYAWYQNMNHTDVLLHHSADLHLRCDTVKESDFYCAAGNAVSSQRSDVLSVQVLMPADSDCIYVINLQGKPIYECVDRLGTTTAKPPPLTTCQATRKIHSDVRNQSSQANITEDLIFSRAWAGVPFWYILLRWSSFASLLIFLCIVIKCTKARQTHLRRRRRRRRKRAIRFRGMSDLTH